LSSEDLSQAYQTLKQKLDPHFNNLIETKKNFESFVDTMYFEKIENESVLKKAYELVRGATGESVAEQFRKKFHGLAKKKKVILFPKKKLDNLFPIEKPFHDQSPQFNGSNMLGLAGSKNCKFCIK
jgi:hypothetical protein